MLLEIKNIKKSFRVGKQIVPAVDDVSFSIEQGVNFGLVGESGCGKTTLARILTKLYAQDDGQILLDGKESSLLKGKDLKEYRTKVQMVFQDPFNSLDPRLNVRNILNEAFTLRKEKDKEERMEQVLSAVRLSGDVLSRYPHEFSGGERQRIAIARALLTDPKLLILDESVSSLDVIIQAQILDLLLSLQQEFDVTYLFISHNLKVIRKICSRTAVMYQGKIVESRDTQALFDDPREPYTQLLLSAAVNYQC